jgi:hypothetical protein
MNQKMKKTETAPKTEISSCFCQGAGPVLTELFRRLGPPQEARRHFDTARLEFLKGLRALLDARIEQVSKTKQKGEKINVE